MIMLKKTTTEIYDSTNLLWSRSKPSILSDYTARPFVLELCKPALAGANILDLGCGEGYMARKLKNLGAENIDAVDISKKMIEMAENSEKKNPLGIKYHVHDCTDLSLFQNKFFDIIISVFMINYISIDQMQNMMNQVFDLLKKGGCFIFTVPHPSLPFIKDKVVPFYFDKREYNYFSGIDKLFEGEIMRRDGVLAHVRSVHKTFENYFNALSLAGFSSLPKVIELGVNSEHLKIDPLFFGSLKGYPLHVAFKIVK